MMTPVEFHFVTPEGVPISDAEVEIQLLRSAFDIEDSGVLMPRLVTATTDEDGKVVVDLWSTTTMYQVRVFDTESDAGLFYKFYVPEMDVPGTVARLQDIVVDVEMENTSFADAVLVQVQTARVNAVSAQIAAQAAATAAASSAQASAASQTASQSSATASAGSATTANTAATTATTKASEASASATGAAGSAATATTKASEASASAAAALTSRNNAATSATGAATSATTATTKATEAATSATSAAGSATTATNQATIATTKASEASTSASNAAGSATAASGSASAAAGSLLAVQQIFDNFDDIYLGSKASNPTVDNDGNPLVEGQLYWNSTEDEIRFYNGAQWERPEHAASQSATSAFNSATAAASSATSAGNSASAANTSAINAANSATAAANSATTATSQAGTATIKASEAVTSATNAANSATAAAGSATTASTGASTATTQAAAAGTSATAAQTSATNAASSATSATASRDAAAVSATTASTKASEASTSATSAQTSATTATTQAGIATTKAAEAVTSANNAAGSATAASGSASTASTQATNAATSATAAQTSATNAAASQTAVATNAATATTQAGIATTRASEAAASASTASTQAGTATTKATEAAASATTATTQAGIASTKASEAVVSATTASTGATTATTQAGISTTKAGESAASATAAAASQLSASDSATIATSQAATATTKASEASTSAANALTQAGIATTKASESALSATAASSARAAAEAARDQTLSAFDNFDDRYLGQKTVDPTVDNDGNALVSGSLYFNSLPLASGGGMKVYDGSAWLAAYASLSGALLNANNLSDLSSASAARTNLELGNVENKSSATIRGELSSSNVTTALGFTPYNATNPTGFITSAALTPYLTSATAASTYQPIGAYLTGITSSQVTTALGFTPYNATNPTGFITSSALSPYLTSATAASTYQPIGSYLTGITSGQVTTALGFTPYNATNPSGYITSSALSPYLTSSTAASTYQPLLGYTAANKAGDTFTGAVLTTNAGGFTANSAAKLWTDSGRGRIDLWEGSAQAKSFLLLNTNAGGRIGMVSNEPLELVTNNIARLTIGADGSVLFGVSSIVRSSNEAGGVILSTQNTNASNATQFFVSHNGSLVNLGNARAGGLALWANGVAHINLTSAGFFGIGKDVPSGPLHVKGANGIYVEGALNTNVGRMVMTGASNEIMAVGLNGVYAGGRVKLGAGAITPANGGWIDSFADGSYIFYGPSSAQSLVLSTAGAATFLSSVTATQFNGSAAGLTGLRTVNGNSIIGSGDIVIAAGVTSFNTRTGAITLSSGDVTGALGFTPYNATNPSGYINTSGARSALFFSAGAGGYNVITGEINIPTNTTHLTNGSGYITASASITGSAATLTTGRTIALTGDVTYTSGSFNGSANVTGTATLANSGVTAGSYMSGVLSGISLMGSTFTVDAKGRVTGVTTNSLNLAQSATTDTTNASNISSGTLAVARGGTGATTAGEALTALGAYAASNPAGYTTNTGTVTSVGGTGTVSGLTLSGTVTGSGNLTLGGTLSLTSGQVTTALGFTPYNATNPSGYITSSALSSYLPLAGGTVSGALAVTGAITQGGNQVLHAANYTSYSPSLTGSGASGSWGISITGSAGSVVTRTSVLTNATSLIINCNTTDIATQDNTQATGTLTIGAPTGTPVNGQKIMLRLTCTNVQTFAWNAIFRGSTDLPLPTASSGGGKEDYLGFIYDTSSLRWDLIAKNFGY